VKRSKVSKTVAEAVVLPKLINLGGNLIGAAFFLMKLLPAKFILERACQEGRLKPESVIVESTSGTFGLALAILCNLENYHLFIVSDPAIDRPLARRMEELGTQVDIVDEPAPVGGFQRARLDRMKIIQEAYPDHFWPSQYSNPNNPAAYAPVAELLTENIGQIDYLIGPVGSGGSMCGTSSYLRLLFPRLRVIGVDSLGSVLFGQPDQGARLLRGLGNSLMPKNLSHSIFDDVHWVSAAEGFAATRLLHRKHALYMGPTSGAAYLVGQWYAAKYPEASIVMLLPDEGYRYQSTIYDDEWLKLMGAWMSEPTSAPRLVKHPWEAGPEWSYINWNRRAYEQVMGGPFRE